MSRELEKTHIEVCEKCNKEHILREGEGLAVCDCQADEQEVLKKEINPTKKQQKSINYEKAYDLLMEYWDSIADEEKPKLDKELKKLGL